MQHLRVCSSFHASDGSWWPEFFEQHSIWSIGKDQPSISFLGLDLICGAAAAGNSRLTAIKLGMILKMLGMNKTWTCQSQTGGGDGEGATSRSLPPPDSTFRLSRFSVTDQTATFLRNFHMSMPHLLWLALPHTNRLWSLASDRGCPKVSSLHSTPVFQE